MIPIIIHILLLAMVGVTFIGLSLRIKRLQRALAAERQEREIDRQVFSDLFKRLDNFLDQWIPATEGATRALLLRQDDLGPHIHWFVDCSSGPNWFVKECRCGETLEGPL